MASLSKSTFDAYSKIIREYKVFIQNLDSSLNKFPLSPTHIALYMSYLFRKGLSPATISCKLSALAFWHQVYGHRDPTSHFLVRRVLIGMKKTKPSTLTRPPMSLNSLSKMLKGASTVGWSPYFYLVN